MSRRQHRGASILMLIPAVMVFLALALKPRVDRWANIILGVLYTAVNIGNLVGKTWAFYLLETHESDYLHKIRPP